jgi:hypothetical protein
MATIHVWTDDPVNLSATLQGDKFKDVKKVEFVFKEGDTEVGRAEAAFDVASGAATGKWDKAKGPDKPAAVRKLNYHVEIDSKPLANLPDEIHVWAKELTVLAKGKDDKPYAGALAHISQTHVDNPSQYRTVDRKTGSDGTITWRLAVPGAVSVTWEPPYFLIGPWTKNTGIDWECKVEKIAPVVLKSPEPGKRKQWVNLDPDVAKPENGPIVKVTVVAGKDGPVEAGKKIYCKAVYGGDNSLRTPMTGAKKPNETLELNADPDAMGGATFDVPVGYAGGDTVLIKVGSTADCIDGSTAIETWRKLSYELMSPDCVTKRLAKNKDDKWDLPKDALQWINTRVEPLFVDYSLKASHIFPDSEITKYMHTAAFLQIPGGSGDYFVCPKNLVFNEADPVPFGATDKRTTFVRCADETAGNLPPALAEQTAVQATTNFKVPGTIFNVSMDDGSPSVTNVQWQAVIAATAPPGHPGRASPNGPGKTGALAAAAIKLLTMKTYQIVLEGEPATLVGADSATKCKIKVTWTWALANRVNGSALGSKQLMHVCRPPRAIACTFVHELGHSAGMTILATGPRARPPPEGLPAPAAVPGGFYYEGKGHNGSHCAFGLSDTDKNLDSYAKKSGSCILFGGGNDDPNPSRDRFCPTCIKYLRARNLQDLEASWATRTGQANDAAEADDDVLEESTT